MRPREASRARASGWLAVLAACGGGYASPAGGDGAARADAPAAVRRDAAGPPGDAAGTDAAPDARAIDAGGADGDAAGRADAGADGGLACAAVVEEFLDAGRVERATPDALVDERPPGWATALLAAPGPCDPAEGDYAPASDDALEGARSFASIAIPAGVVVYAAGDLALCAAGDVAIDGHLEVAGALDLLAGGDLIVRGRILAGAAAIAAASPDAEVTIDGEVATLGPDEGGSGALRVASAGSIAVAGAVRSGFSPAGASGDVRVLAAGALSLGGGSLASGDAGADSGRVLAQGGAGVELSAGAAVRSGASEAQSGAVWLSSGRDLTVEDAGVGSGPAALGTGAVVVGAAGALTATDAAVRTGAVREAGASGALEARAAGAIDLARTDLFTGAGDDSGGVEVRASAIEATSAGLYSGQAVTGSSGGVEVATSGDLRLLGGSVVATGHAAREVGLLRARAGGDATLVRSQVRGGDAAAGVGGRVSLAAGGPVILDRSEVAGGGGFPPGEASVEPGAAVEAGPIDPLPAPGAEIVLRPLDAGAAVTGYRDPAVVADLPPGAAALVEWAAGGAAAGRFPVFSSDVAGRSGRWLRARVRLGHGPFGPAPAVDRIEVRACE